MQLKFTEKQKAFRQEVQEWLAHNVPKQPLKSYDTREGFEEHRLWEAKLYESRLSMVMWPEHLGGRGCDLIEWLIFEEEYYSAGAPMRVNHNGQLLLGPTLMEFGTEEQKKHFLPRIASSEDMWAQGWSEPDAGSDMAAIRSRATPDGDEFVINGQKTWSTRAIYADWLFGLFRTDPESKRHHGLSYMMVPLNAPGVTVRPIKALNGKEAFAEVFFDDVRIPAFNCIGEVGQGWAVAMATAGFERGLLLRSPARFQSTVKRLVDLYRKYAAEHGENGRLRDAVIDCWMGAEAYAHSAYHTVGLTSKGAKIGAESSINKIIWSELDLKMHEAAMEMLGAYAELQPGSPDVVEDGNWLEGFLFAQAGPIYAGTNEIQRNIIAERMLELPRG
ncbi:MAG: acyl-CoA dehydrogenase family protein [Pseudomonas sp.]|jgi:alkylation response protein AidB-like acyl-CoA dehydrogenase|nr:acyl-CoA dehydrogenase family protein [Pseudomonas sp.]MDD2222001.1 acyl-CoA dehydrogenase family protein [Pseudomonas sp.]MDY0414760.1 acyl-CoA dehydrogenase family protein [Pseudomonas sp.]NLO52840.1 acyl-CoA dehydrogenase [Gammaproteobacteria bacterium]